MAKATSSRGGGSGGSGSTGSARRVAPAAHGEDIGLLAPDSPGNDDADAAEGGLGRGDSADDSDGDDDGDLIVHAGNGEATTATPTAAAAAGNGRIPGMPGAPLPLSRHQRTPSASSLKSSTAASSATRGPLAPNLVTSSLDASGSPRTPRTPNRVRFDLVPQVVFSPSSRRPNGFAADSPRSSGDTYDSRSSGSSFDFDGADPESGGGSASARERQHRLPLLTDIEAPSVTLARSGEMDTESDVEAWAERERSRPKSGLRSAFMNMANSIIGAGIIGQPYAMRQAGLAAGVVLLLVLTVLVDWTIRLIVVNSKLSGASSFQGTVERCFGRPGLIAISLAQWVFAFGGMVAFGVIVGDSIPHVLRAVFPRLGDVPVLGLLTDRRVVIVVCLLAVSYPLTLYRDIAKLAKASTFALVSMIVIITTVVIQGILVPSEDRGSFSTPLLTVNSGIFQAIGVISFAFVCHHNSLLIYGSLKTPTIDRFTRVTHYSTAVSMVACMLMALTGFLVFGDRTLGNVLNNFPADNTMVNIARLCFGLNMLTTLPLEAFVCREVMFNYYFPGEPFNMHLHIIFSTCLVLGAMVLSVVTCDLGAIFELVGATSACAMAYILPPLCYIKLTKRSWRTYLAWGIVVFGCTVMVISLLQAITKMVSGKGGSQHC